MSLDVCMVKLGGLGFSLVRSLRSLWAKLRPNF